MGPVHLDLHIKMASYVKMLQTVNLCTKCTLSMSLKPDDIMTHTSKETFNFDLLLQPACPLTANCTPCARLLSFMQFIWSFRPS